MPGTALRACSSRTNVFQAASSGRGSAVTMTVSSMSETTPKLTAGSTIRTGASTGSAPSVLSRTVAQPGGEVALDPASTKPLRSVRVSCRRSPASMVHRRRALAGSVVKLRQPRTFSSRPRCRVPGRLSSTRPITRTQPGAP